MQTPCKDCPFRKDVRVYLTPERRQDIANAVILGDGGFPCHKTVTYKNDKRINTQQESPCIGAIQMIENVRGDARASLYVRLAAMCGKIDLNQISNEIEVYDSVEEFVKASRLIN